MNDLSISRSLLDPDLHQSLIQYFMALLAVCNMSTDNWDHQGFLK